jgi:hypothetical protein
MLAAWEAKTIPWATLSFTSPLPQQVQQAHWVKSESDLTTGTETYGGNNIWTMSAELVSGMGNRQI